MTSSFESINDLCFMSWGDATTDIHLINDICEFFSIHLLDFCSA